ncbi:type II secretion system protein [Vibrio sp. S17_S38]|uniref:pilus assembly FimT family protein n=1 Tax=Vibrio sp. S17_S38 TaxID=2720229 RepID=UPI00167FF533|nr:type II secretion system protein [Vibrio sp. S17_S38]MBD1574509.1 type II secretion system protein [Vibrio sp. S17_S38]
MPKRFHIQRGFTLIELMVVIIILAILSVYAATRFQGPSSFSPYAAQAQAISVIRQIQLARMQSNTQNGSTNDNYILSITSNCLGSKMSCSGISDLSSKVEVDGQEMQFSPSNVFIEFDLLGRPYLLGKPMQNQDYEITISSITNESTKVCINTEGFVYGC